MKWMLLATLAVAALAAGLFTAVAWWSPAVAVEDADEAKEHWGTLLQQTQSWGMDAAWILLAPGLVGLGLGTVVVAMGPRWHP